MTNNLKTALFSFAYFCVCAGANAQISGDKTLFATDSLTLISSQFKFTEGASTDAKGNVFFTDQPNNQIWKYDTEGKLSLFVPKAGRSNGTYFDHKGNLITAADEHNELWTIDKKGTASLLYKNPPGQNLNGPNDLWIDAKGGIYFTDPYYQRDYWSRKAPDLVGEKVYYLPKGKNELLTVDDKLVRPNGIVGTSDGKTLYVADAMANKIYQYDIEKDGRLTNRRIFLNRGSDGITLDDSGNLYLTGIDVVIYSSTGKELATIKVPEKRTGNICFGGKNKDILFIAASKSVFKIKMNVKGVE